MLKTVLIVLTISATGQTHFSMVETETTQACHKTAEMIGGILAETDVQVAAMRCGQTQLNLTEFVHGHPEEDMVWHYRVTVDGTELDDGFSAEHVASGSCTETGAQTYCAISAQHPIAQ